MFRNLLFNFPMKYRSKTNHGHQKKKRKKPLNFPLKLSMLVVDLNNLEVPSALPVLERQICY